MRAGYSMRIVYNYKDWVGVETLVLGLEFAYSQAPVSMKSTVQSFWLLTTAVGNVIVIFLVSVKIGNTQVCITHFP